MPQACQRLWRPVGLRDAQRTLTLASGLGRLSSTGHVPHDTGHLSDMKPEFLVHCAGKGAARRAAGVVGTGAGEWDGEVCEFSLQRRPHSARIRSVMVARVIRRDGTAGGLLCTIK